MSSVSRRKLIEIGVIGGAGALLSPLFNESAFGVSSIFAATSSAGALLQVRSASEPSSLDRLDQLFPGLRSQPGFRQLLPVAFLVSNVSGEAIRAFSSHWTLRMPSSTQELVVHHYFHRRGVHRGGVHFGSKGNHTRVTATVPAIRAGETRLVTPFFSWNSAYYRRHSAPNWEKILNHRARKQVVVSELQSDGATVSMEIVAAVLRDFSPVGPGGDRLRTIIRVSRNAEHNEAASIRNRMAAGANREQVRALLQHHASGLAFDIRPDSDLYYRVRQRQAKVLLRRLKHARWEQFVRTIEYFKKKPKIATPVGSGVLHMI
jgi:hypothetical protein